MTGSTIINEQLAVKISTEKCSHRTHVSLLMIDGGRYSIFRFARFAKGDGALPALIAAQRLRWSSAMAFRPAALSVRMGAS